MKVRAADTYKNKYTNARKHTYSVCMDACINRGNFLFPVALWALVWHWYYFKVERNSFSLSSSSLLLSFPTSLSTVSSSHCLAGCTVMCHFIILRWLNYIRNILSLIKPAIGSTWDKTDYKSWAWKHWVRNAGISTLCVCVCVCVCVFLRVSGRRKKSKRACERETAGRNGTVKICQCALVYMDGAAAVKSSASLQSIRSPWFSAYPLRDGLSITGLVSGLMDSIHMLFCTASDRWCT